MSGIKSVSLLLLGAAIGAGAIWQWAPSSGMSSGDSRASGEKQPLYWVAPMDPNYRRDKPGKSPMGMDLIPVYEEDQGGSEVGAGTIKISPEVVNNLGVRLGKVTREALNVNVNTVGYLKYNQDALVHVHPRVEGWVEKAFVKTAGEKVSKGTPLYTLYSPVLVNAQEEFLFALSTGDKRLQDAATARLKAYKMTDGFIETLRKQRKVRQTVEFLSPTDGVIDTFNLTEGMFIKPGMTVLSIVSLDQMWVDAEVFERQSAWVKQGQTATMTLEAYPGEQWQGEVDYIYPALNEKTRTLRVRLRFDNPEHRLKPNMFARLNLQGSSDQTVLAVPQNAVIRGSGDSRIVLALGEGRFKSIYVKTGRSDGRMTEVLDGLKEGEQVVMAAHFMLDSESSKTSDFKRMHQGENSAAKPASVWVEATVVEIKPQQKMLTLTHKPVDVWGWPAMTMDFTLADSVAMPDVSEGTVMHVEIRDEQGQFPITGIHIPDDQPMDHSQHQGMSQSEMPPMDHSQHQGMNQSEMPVMDHSQHQGISQSEMPAMDHSQHQGMNQTEMPAMDHSQHNMQGGKP